MIVFYDETGASTLPPGVLVMFWDANGDNLGNGYTQIDGSVDFALTEGATYSATFRGTQGPTALQSFEAGADPTSVTVANYMSPSLSEAAWSSYARGIRPIATWFDAPGKTPVLDAILEALAATNGTIDNEEDYALAMGRAQTSFFDNLLDTFAADFFGPYLLRYDGESNEAFYARILLGFGPRCTLPVLQAIVDHYFKIFPSFGSSGYDLFDTYSNPEKAAYYGLIADDAQFALLEYFPPTIIGSWFVGQGYLGQTTFISSPLGFTKYNTIPYPELAAEIDRARAKGTVPIYIRSLGDPYS